MEHVEVVEESVLSDEAIKDRHHRSIHRAGIQDVQRRLSGGEFEKWLIGPVFDKFPKNAAAAVADNKLLATVDVQVSRTLVGWRSSDQR